MAATSKFNNSHKPKGSFKRDFGLGQHRIAFPEADDGGSLATASGEPASKKKTKRRSVGERVMDMFHIRRRGETSGEKEKAKLASPPSPQQALAKNLMSLPTNSSPGLKGSPRACSSVGTPSMSPSPSLHSRILGKQNFSEAKRDSFEAVMHEYGFKKDGTPMLGRKKLRPEENLVRLKIKSPGRDEEDKVTIIKDDKGTGIQLSVGLPPFTVTYVEPGSKGMQAGVQKGDTILEVNGKDCSSMDSFQLPEIMELKSIIAHVPGSRPSSALSRRKFNGKPIPVTSINSDSNSSEEGDDEEDQYSGNEKRRKKKITKGVWNRMKAEGLQDSDSDSSGSFINLQMTVMDSSSDEDDFIDKWNEQVLNKEKEIEMDDKQWKQMKERQNLIFTTDAPSFVISNPQTSTFTHHQQQQLVNTSNPLTGGQLASKKKRHFKWPFTRPATAPKPPLHKQVKKTGYMGNPPRTKSPLESVMMAESSSARILRSTDDNASNTGDSDNSSIYERPQILEKASVEGRMRKSSRSHEPMTRKPSRSQSLTEKSRVLPIRPKRLSKEAPPDIGGIKRTTPLLGVSEGRNRRDVARARNIRKPTSRGKLGGGGETTDQSITKETTPRESVNSNTTSGHQITKAISDPGNTPSIENQQKEGEKEEAPKKASRRRSSAALVEEAVRRRNLAKTEKKDIEEEEEKEKGTPSRRRKHAVVRNSFETSAVHQPTAQIVANAAAIKAKEMKKQKPLRDEKRKELIKSQGYKEQKQQLVMEEKRKGTEKLPTFHPLQKSRSFEGEKVTGRTQEPTWISLAKAKHEKMTTAFSINRSMSLHNELDRRGREEEKRPIPMITVTKIN